MVGGCVRDFLMEKIPSDWDVCTNAKPEQTLDVLKDGFSVIPTGVKHGTVTVISDGNPVEVTTYRSESGYSDFRRPESVSFLSSIDGDLSRRDFTVNAMAYNHEKGIIDLFGGAEDLKNGILRCVGNPDTRFREDALRIMRALRFSAVCSFEIEDETSRSIIKNAELLKEISVERIYTELKKLLLSKQPSYIFDKYSSVFGQIIPEILCGIRFDVLDSLPKELPVRLAALFYGTYAEREILSRLKTDKEIRAAVCAISECTEKEVPKDKAELKLMMNKYGEDAVRNSFKLNLLIKDNKEMYRNAIESVDEIIGNKECYLISQLDINGSDLIKCGIKRGEKDRRVAQLSSG